MQTNRVKAALRANQAVTGPILGEVRAVGTIRIMAREGFDFLFLDGEHALFDNETLLTLVQTALLCEICPLVRVTDLSYPLIARALDSGAQGIIVPRVETREQAEAAVAYAKYPPLGRRGAGGEARTGYGRLDTRTAVETANAEGLIVLQIESAEGVRNLDAIASVSGVNVLCVGPQDLSISLDVHGDFSHPTFLAAIAQVVAAGRTHGIASGMVERDAADLRRWFDLGMRFLVSGSDGAFLAKGAAESVATIRAFSR